MKKNKFSVHCEEESKVYFFFRSIKEVLVRPILPVLVNVGITPDLLSYIGVISVFPFVYFFSFNPWISLFFLVIHIFLDLLDGSLARYLNISSERGAFIDMVCDYLVFFITISTFCYYDFIDCFIGLVFSIVYLTEQGFISLAVLKGIKLFPVFRAKLFIYFFFVLYLITGFNFMNEVLLISVFYTFIADFFIFRKIICSL